MTCGPVLGPKKEKSRSQGYIMIIQEIYHITPKHKAVRTWSTYCCPSTRVVYHRGSYIKNKAT